MRKGIRHLLTGLLVIICIAILQVQLKHLYAEPIVEHKDDSFQRIVSLGPTLTEELYLLDVEDKIVGVTTYCNRPPQAQQKEKIGTVTKANLEKIVGLKPDLVLATSLTDPKAIEKLRNLGISVVIFQQAKNFSQLCEQFLKLGKIVGKEKETDEIVHMAENKVNAIKEKVEGLPKPTVFVQIGANPLYAATKDSFINDFIESAGGINIVQTSGTGLYSREKVLEANPDVIIIVTMGISGEEEKKVWKKFETMNASKNDRIYVIDCDRICSPTPVTFIEGLRDIAKILHPHLELEQKG